MTEMTNEELQNLDDDEFERMQALQDEIVENTEDVKEVQTEVQNDTVEEEPTISEGSKETDDSEETEEVEETEETDETEEEKEPQDDIEPEDDTTEEESLETDDTNDNDDDTDDTDKEEETKEEPSDELDYKLSYEEFMKPIKVSGKEIQIKSIEDARNLISMGIDYSRKMRDVKPLRVLGETLTEAGIIEDGKINEAALLRLVDISKGDKTALAELMAEKDIDPLDINTEDVQYTPTAQMAAENSYELKDVEQELANRGSIDTVITELGKLDKASKQFFNESPRDLLKLDEDIKNGTYEKLMDTVRYERTLGRLRGISDIEAYIQLAQAQEPIVSEQKQVADTKPKTKPSVRKRKAAAITKRAPAKKQTQKTYDYVNMSDEEFEKLAMSDNFVY